MLETEKGGNISPLQRTLFGRGYIPVVKSDCGMNGQVTFDPQFLNSVDGGIGIALADCG
jgi:hypothetical protein